MFCAEARIAKFQKQKKQVCRFQARFKLGEQNLFSCGSNQTLMKTGFLDQESNSDRSDAVTIPGQNQFCSSCPAFIRLEGSLIITLLTSFHQSHVFQIQRADLFGSSCFWI